MATSSLRSFSVAILHIAGSALAVRRSSAIALALALSACSQKPASPPDAAANGRIRTASGSTPIQHIVLLVQENRSFDNLFATFPGADGTMTGQLKNKTIRLHMAKLNSKCSYGHLYPGFRRDYNGGKMNGFWDEGGDTGNAEGCPVKAGKGPYQYVNPGDVAPYWQIAKQYVLADHMFQTQGSGSFTAHQDLIRGGTTFDQYQTESFVDVPDHAPWGCDAPQYTVTTYLLAGTSHPKYKYHQGPFPCTNIFASSGANYRTLRDLLDAQSVSWKYYVPPLTQHNSGNLWNAFDVIAPVRYGSEWTTNVASPETKIFSDIKNQRLAAMSWVIPDLKNSDHPRSGSDTGPSWVAHVVNAIGESRYWQSTAIIIVWDDWGGFYDHVPPAFFDEWGGLGFRVPMLVVSPYARETSSSEPGYISHSQYEFGSIVKFVEETWNLGLLGTTDGRATSIDDCFDFSQQPRGFTPISAPYGPAFFDRQQPSFQPVDTE
jgi:phospholipase C